MLRSSISPLLWRSAARLAPRAPAFSSSAAPMSTAFSSSSTPAQAAEGSILSRRSSTLIISVRDEPARTVTGFGHILTATPETSDVFEEGSPLRMGDSFLLRYYPFSSDPVLKERYLNPYGRIRIGKILEDLDGFAGSVAYTHCQRHLLTSTPASADSEAAPSETNLSATIVTAAVNQIMLLNQIRAERDMRMTGHVSWVGRSSLDVRIMVESLVADPSAPAPAAGSKPTPNTDPNANWEPLVMADFTMVALDPNTRKATVVPRLELKNALENDIFSHGQERSKQRKVEKALSLSESSPTPMETDMIHKLYLRSQKYKKLMEDGVQLTDEVIPTSKTCLDTTIFCHRQERNVHGKLFGGYLMRHAFELAFCTALTYTGGAMPIFLGQDEIQFKKPVEIGSLLSFKSRIELAEGSTGDNPNASQFQVEVMADVIDPATGDRDTTNVFHYTFQVPNKPLRTVVPQTYEEFMAYVMAQRRRSNSAAVFKHYQGKISTWTIPVPDRLHWHE